MRKASLIGMLLCLFLPDFSYSQWKAAPIGLDLTSFYQEDDQRMPETQKLTRLQRKRIKNPWYVNLSFGLKDDSRMASPTILGVHFGKERRFDESMFGWQYELGARYIQYKIIERNTEVGQIEYNALDIAVGPSLRFNNFSDGFIPYVNVYFGASRSYASDAVRNESQLLKENGWWDTPMLDTYQIYAEMEIGFKSGYHDPLFFEYNGFTLAYRFGTLYHSRIVAGLYFTINNNN